MVEPQPPKQDQGSSQFSCKLHLRSARKITIKDKPVQLDEGHRKEDAGKVEKIAPDGIFAIHKLKIVIQDELTSPRWPRTH